MTELTKFDEWLNDGSIYAALTGRSRLTPIEGSDAIIFPPTYAEPEGWKNGEWLGYSIDQLPGGTKICQIDSVGSQANRMEPIFKRGEYAALIPQVVIRAGERNINILEAGHRGADAVVRFSDLGVDLHEAFSAWQKTGNAEPLARIAPTSIVFGSWDSRATQAKLPRIVRSVIRAYGIELIHRSAQYTTIAGEILEGGEAEVTTKGPKAELGMAHVPAVYTHGGIRVFGEIRRESSLLLPALRALGAANGDALPLRRYILGLALVAFSAPQEVSLRQGCELVPDVDHPATWQIVQHDGARNELQLEHQEALAYAKTAAEAFGVSSERRVAIFDKETAKGVLALPKDVAKVLLRSGPVTADSLQKAKTKKSKSQESAA